MVSKIGSNAWVGANSFPQVTGKTYLLKNKFMVLVPCKAALAELEVTIVAFGDGLRVWATLVHTTHCDVSKSSTNVGRWR